MTPAHIRNMPSPDPRVRLIHELDQFGAVLRDLAPVLGRFRTELMRAGYTQEEAVGITESLLLDLCREYRLPPTEDTDQR